MGMVHSASCCRFGKRELCVLIKQSPKKSKNKDLNLHGAKYAPRRDFTLWYFYVKLHFKALLLIVNPLPITLRWIIGAAVVNAFYSPNRNQIGKSFMRLNEATGSLCDNKSQSVLNVILFTYCVFTPVVFLSSVSSRNPAATFLQ